MNAERKRLEEQRKGKVNWRLWGPYLAERAWGTVREDYSPGGSAWEYFDHDQARSRAYRWNEDGLGGICDERQRLCLALALWNGKDPILKERAFGLTGNQGNHGEDVKEYYFYLDATPSHSFLRYTYKYPQAEYPYERLVEENRRRSRHDGTFSLLDAGAFEENRYWDVELTYAKIDAEAVQLRITIHNRGPEKATLHLLPTLWFRNTWSWGGGEGDRPRITAVETPSGAAWCVSATHPELGTYNLYGRTAADLLFTDNESNAEKLWNAPNSSAFVKDAFHRRVVEGDSTAVNRSLEGTKFAAWSVHEIAGGDFAQLDYLLTTPRNHFPLVGFKPFKNFERVLDERKTEADTFYHDILPDAAAEEAGILRQAMAGLVWSKQFYHCDIVRWLEGDAVPPPESRKRGRNSHWRHLKAADIISMPDTWEYPWFAAWDLAFHAVAMALIDIDLAKEQLELLLTDRYLHPSGQIPAYEWSFGDVNPPVHAFAALECYRIEEAQRGAGDRGFLLRVFNKLILNYGWWLNRKDPGNRSVFGGGFMGLDNISVYDRSQPLPHGYSLRQADATGWMAMFALNLTVIALELAQEDPAYEEMAIQIHGQFFAIAKTVHGYNDLGLALWDRHESFFKDAVETPAGMHHLPVYSWVGLIPLFGCEVVGAGKLEKLPRYREFLMGHAGGFHDGNIVCACPYTVNSRGEHLFTLTEPANIPTIVERVLDAGQFLSPHGVRSLSRVHAERQDLGEIPGLGAVSISYDPGESSTGLFGGNSNWRGPVWFPLNYILVSALDRFQRYLGDSFTVIAPALGGELVTMGKAADIIAGRLIDLFRRDEQGLRPAFPRESPFQHDPHWRDLILFHEYFHGETGHGLGASHQTGWTALVANLICRQHEKNAGRKAG
jgi:hypothetical protein